MQVSVTGIPGALPPASDQGFGIVREYFLPDGTPADLNTVSQNDRFVVVLTVAYTYTTNVVKWDSDAVSGETVKARYDRLEVEQMALAA